MKLELPDTTELQALVAAIEEGSISAGAKRLGVPRATMSRRLTGMEERVGTRLLRRTTRALQPTPAGAELYRHAQGILSALEDAARAVQLQDDTPRGLLRVSVPPLNSPSLRSMLTQFAADNPAVQLEVLATTRHVDLVSENIDVAWRAGDVTDPGLIARRLRQAELIAVASPDYLERMGRPQSPGELADHDCLVGFARGERPGTVWPTPNGPVEVRVRLATNEILLAYQAALEGLGISLTPRVLAQADLNRGTMEQVLAGQVGRAAQISLVFVERKLMRPALRAFLDYAVAWSERLPMDIALMDLN